MVLIKNLKVDNAGIFLSVFPFTFGVWEVPMIKLCSARKVHAGLIGRINGPDQWAGSMGRINGTDQWDGLMGRIPFVTPQLIGGWIRALDVVILN